MEKVKVTIERGSDNRFSLHTEFELNGYGLLGYGDTVEAAIEDFNASYEEAREMLQEKGGEVPDIEFEYLYDVASFLDYYNGILSKSGLEKITGINQKQLWHYQLGGRNPKPATVKKIQESLHKFAEDLMQVRFID